jgi:hypothetical protein
MTKPWRYPLIANSTMTTIRKISTTGTHSA